MKQLKFFISTIIVIINFHQCYSQKVKVNKKPNVIFILADDLGIGNVGTYGADHYQTPNIDDLAINGIQFNHAYTEPLCGPSRAMILTGRYPFRTGGTNQDACIKMNLSEIFMPSLFKSAGYATSCIGKWGQLPAGPKESGFDDFIKFKGSGVYKNTSDKTINYIENEDEKLLKDNEYMPDLMHEHLIEFIKQNKDNPFFVYYPMSHVHGKIVPTPDSKSDSKDLFADNVQYMDKLVGKLVQFLDSMKLRDNTMIVFMGDNGTGNQWYKNSTIGGKILSGKKGEMKECGSLVPLIISWRGKVSKGFKSEQLIDATDFIPTFADIIGVKLPKNKTFDGFSFSNNFIPNKKNQRDWIFIELGNDWYVRTNKWKLNRAGNLFDMSNAPFEEVFIPENNKEEQTIKAKRNLQSILNKLAPEKGILDTGSGDGRHASKANKVKLNSKEAEE